MWFSILVELVSVGGGESENLEKNPGSNARTNNYHSGKLLLGRRKRKYVCTVAKFSLRKTKITSKS